MDEIGKLSFDFNYIFMCRSSISSLLCPATVFILCFVFKSQEFFIRLNTVFQNLSHYSIWNLHILNSAIYYFCLLPLRIIWCALLDFWLWVIQVFGILWGLIWNKFFQREFVFTFEHLWTELLDNIHVQVFVWIYDFLSLE